MYKYTFTEVRQFIFKVPKHAVAWIIQLIKEKNKNGWH